MSYQEYFHSLRSVCEFLTGSVQNPYPADEMLANLKDAKARLDEVYGEVVTDLETKIKDPGLQLSIDELDILYKFIKSGPIEEPDYSSIVYLLKNGLLSQVTAGVFDITVAGRAAFLNHFENKPGAENA